MVAQREPLWTTLQGCNTAGVKVLANGPLLPMEHDQFADVDNLVLNEDEETLRSFLPDLEQGHQDRVFASTKYQDMLTGLYNRHYFDDLPRE